MRLRAPALLVCAFFVMTPLSAQRRQTAETCGTSAETIDRLESVHRWTTSRRKPRAAVESVPRATIRDGIVVMAADDRNAPFRHAFDLEGREITFERKDPASFIVTNAAASFDADTGSLRTASAGQAVALPFEFPFFSTRLTRIWVSPFNGIYGAPPDTANFDQYGPIELAVQPSATIAPLLMTPSVLGAAGASVFVRTAPDVVVITWSFNSGAISYRVQARLFPSGRIVFAYPSVTGVASAAILVTPGRDALSLDSEQIASVSDASGDVVPEIDAGRVKQLDIESLSIAENQDNGLVEFRLTLAAPPSASSLSATEFMRFDVLVGAPPAQSRVSYWIMGDGKEEYSAPVWGTTVRNPAARVEGRTVVLDVLEDYLGAGVDRPVTITARTALSTAVGIADSVTAAAGFRAPRRGATSFGGLQGPAEIRGLAAEAFTLPIFDPFSAWDELKSIYSFSDNDWDTVAFYQNFTTDIIYYAGAYSTLGNPGADGIFKGNGVGSAFPRFPNLLHMNRIGFAKNTDAKSAARVLMHEFGHLWLYAFAIHEDGFDSRVLSPAGAHPAQYVDTTAAFIVYDSDDASVMGGGHFTDSGNSTFTSSKYSAYGYSWLDLYMMGLASAEDVRPSYYIRNSIPALGRAYFPPERQTFRGERRNVRIQQVIDAMGARTPAYPFTQRHFKVLIVLLEDPEHPATDDEIGAVQMYRAAFADKFAIATGGRAVASTEFEAPPQRRHAVGR